MLRAVSKFLKASKSAVAWTKALQQASREEYDQSLITLERIYIILGAGMPSSRATPDINILCAVVSSKLGKSDLAISATRVALKQLNNSDLYSENDRNYLRYFCKTILEFCSASTSYETFREAAAVDVSFYSLKFDEVRDDLRRNFPVTKPIASELMRPS